MKIDRIATGKPHTSKVIQSLHVVKVCIDMITKTVVILYRMTNKPFFYTIIVHVTPGNRHLTHIYYLEEFFLLSHRPWHTKCCLHVTLRRQTFRYSIGSDSKTTIYFRREFPSKH